MANSREKYYQKRKHNPFEGKGFWIAVATISVVFVLLIIFVFWNPFKIRSYAQMKEITVPEIFTVNKDPKVTSYYVLFYKPKVCQACMEAEPYVVEYAEKARTNKGKINPIYVINVLETSSVYIAGSTEEASLDGIKDYRNIKVKFTPTLVEVTGGQISDSWDERTSVLNELQDEESKLNQVSLKQFTNEVVLFKGKEHAFN